MGMAFDKRNLLRRVGALARWVKSDLSWRRRTRVDSGKEKQWLFSI
jgi:hypothetical protein